MGDGVAGDRCDLGRHARCYEYASLAMPSVSLVGQGLGEVGGIIGDVSDVSDVQLLRQGCQATPAHKARARA